ncbi:phosphatidylinositol 4-phosphate 5-kinase type-1 alpha [Trichonephila clavipes]|nr:phosphatidylinositol 4-phosphate 5-kinase type-1 alpha [Trichonephila clavipes]
MDYINVTPGLSTLANENYLRDRCKELKDHEKQGSPRERQKPRANTDPVPPRMISGRSSTRSVGKTYVTWDRTVVVSLFQVTIQTESTGDCVSETSSSSTSGLGSTLHTATWTPPHSVEGSTPTHTEGTPSFTESSSSGDAACPTTPVKSINKSLDYLSPLGETQILQGSEMGKVPFKKPTTKNKSII